MIKRTILATAVAALSIPATNAAPYQPMDARGIAMGNTGVASAKRAHAPAYNPSLLSQRFGKDHFAIILPQVGVAVADEREMIDTAQDITDEIFPRFEEAVKKQGAGTSLEEGIDGLKIAITDLETSINSISGVTAANIDPTLDDLRAKNDALNIATSKVQQNLNTVGSATKELTDALKSISGSPLAAKVGLGTTVSIPGKKISTAVSVGGNANISAQVNFSDRDINLLNAYTPATEGYVGSTQVLSNSLDATLNSLEGKSSADKVTGIQSAEADLKTSATSLKGYQSDPVEALGNNPVISGGKLTSGAADPDLNSTLEVVAVSIMDVGVSLASEFEFSGHTVAIGVTPKIQKISTYHYGDEIDGFDDVETDDLKDYQKDYTRFNLDVGASYRFGENSNWMAGAVIKNLFGGSFKYEDALVTPKDENGNANGVPYYLTGGKVSLNPQVRGGIAYHSKWFNAAFDLDLIKNKAVVYEAETQYASLGVELDVYQTFQLRAGYRTNLVSGGADVATAGIGLSPFGVHLDIAAMANPSDVKREAGAVLDLGFYF